MKRVGSVRWEVARKGVHMLVGVAIVLLIQGKLLTTPVLGLLTILFAMVVFYNFHAEEELLSRLLSINRADAAIPGIDILSYFFGCWLVLALFTQQIAFAAIMILAFGDSIAHLISRSFGATQTMLTRTTYLEGTVAGTIAATLAAWAFIPLIPALLASAAAMIVEAGELRIGDHHIDDNLVIPVVAGVILYLIAAFVPLA